MLSAITIHTLSLFNHGGVECLGVGKRFVKGTVPLTQLISKPIVSMYKYSDLVSTVFS